MKLRGIDFPDIYIQAGASRLLWARLYPRLGQVSQTLSLFAGGGSSRRKIYLGAGTVVANGVPKKTNFKKYLHAFLKKTATSPMILSLVSLGDTKEARMQGWQECLDCMRAYKETQTEPYGIELDFSWPTDAFDQNELSDEIREAVVCMSSLSVPLVLKVSILMSPDTLADLMQLDALDALSVGESIPWRAFPEDAKKVFFRTTKAPFTVDGGGRVSGKYILHLANEWIKQVRRAGMRKPILSGAGLLEPKNISEMHEAGVTAFVLSSALAVRPWLVPRIIVSLRAHEHKNNS